jgi:hypothetical protein
MYFNLPPTIQLPDCTAANGAERILTLLNKLRKYLNPHLRRAFTALADGSFSCQSGLHRGSPQADRQDSFIPPLGTPAAGVSLRAGAGLAPPQTTSTDRYLSTHHKPKRDTTEQAYVLTASPGHKLGRNFASCPKPLARHNFVDDW